MTDFSGDLNDQANNKANNITGNQGDQVVVTSIDNPLLEEQNSIQNTVSSDNLSEINRDFKEKAILKLAQRLKISYVNLSNIPLNPDFLKIISLEESEKMRAVVFYASGKKLKIAAENPQDLSLKKYLEKLSEDGYEMEISLASSDSIDAALELYQKNEKYKKIELVENVEEKNIQSYEKEIEALSSIPKEIAKLTAEEGLNLINIGAMKTGASDIHFEPEENEVLVRIRIDGVLHRAFALKYEVYRKISTQLKYESKLQLNKTTVPQDGRYVFNYNGNKIAVRVATIPTPYGESFVCRLLPSSQKPLTLEDLGFRGIALEKLKQATEISHGMILASGPTGSGKTSTLYSILNTMSTPENKVITLEDPVEYQIPNVIQSQIDEKNNYNFATGLRAILRNDPDIVMLGEIRDKDAAETAIQAALTGHVLLSTIHANSAIETVARLRNMNLPSFMIAPSLHTIVAQRLVRKVCPDCVKTKDLEECEKIEFENVYKLLRNLNIFGPSELVMPEKIPVVTGCSKCSNTGYRGRTVVCEVIHLNEELKKMILEGKSTTDLIGAARKNGLITMREDGFIKVALGITTLEEVYRVTNVNL